MIEKGLLLFLEYKDDKIAQLVRDLDRLDYIADNDKVFNRVKAAKDELKRTFKDFASESLEFMTKTQLKEVIFQRKLPEYIRLIMFQILSEINDLSIEANKIVSSVVKQFNELYQHFFIPHTKFSSTDLLEKWNK